MFCLQCLDPDKFVFSHFKTNFSENVENCMYRRLPNVKSYSQDNCCVVTQPSSLVHGLFSINLAGVQSSRAVAHIRSDTRVGPLLAHSAENECPLAAHRRANLSLHLSLVPECVTRSNPK